MSKKYYQKRQDESGEKKGSVSEAGYNEENEVTSTQSPKKNPAPPKSTLFRSRTWSSPADFFINILIMGRYFFQM